MYGIAQDKETTRVTGLAIQDSLLDVVVGESFIDYPWDKVAMDKAREPLANNARVCFDPLSKITLSELAWFFDPFRQEQVPDYGPDAIEKMRQPLLSYSHYRVGPNTLRILSDLAWS
jgi:hypothetical protein